MFYHSVQFEVLLGNLRFTPHFDHQKCGRAEDNKRNKTPNGVIDNFNTMGIVALYLERVTGLKSHMDFTFAGPAYRNTMLWDQDILQWRGWWDANKDYIFWDEQAQALKVKPH